jgi:hypothetical protein
LLVPLHWLGINPKMSDEAALAVEVDPDTTVPLLLGLERPPMATGAASHSAENTWQALVWQVLQWPVLWKGRAVVRALANQDLDPIADLERPSPSSQLVWAPRRLLAFTRNAKKSKKREEARVARNAGGLYLGAGHLLKSTLTRHGTRLV